MLASLDDWQDKISWVSPALLYDLGADYPENSAEAQRRLVQLISVAKLQEAAWLLEQSVGGLDQRPALERVPLGLYAFTLQDERHSVVLVYSHLDQAYRTMLADLPQLLKEADLNKNLTLDQAEIEQILPTVQSRYFGRVDPLLAPRPEDLGDILTYFAEKGVAPPYLAFTDRQKYDVAVLARDIVNQDFGPRAQKDYLLAQWQDTTTFWQVYYGNHLHFFLQDVQREITRLLFPPPPSPTKPTIVSPDPEPPAVDRQAVLARDQYRCLCCGEDRRSRLQIDHIVPRAHGGDNAIDNLQTLCRVCNGYKGDLTIDFRLAHSQLSAPPDGLRQVPPPETLEAGDRQSKYRYFKRVTNLFYHCAAAAAVSRTPDGWQIDLHPGNDPAWLRAHLPSHIKLSQASVDLMGEPASTAVKGVLDPTSSAAALKPIASPQPASLKSLPDGTACYFEYKQQRFEGHIQKGQLVIPTKGHFETFSQASRTLTQTNRNGWRDWYLNLPGSQAFILADDWRNGKNS